MHSERYTADICRYQFYVEFACFKRNTDLRQCARWDGIICRYWHWRNLKAKLEKYTWPFKQKLQMRGGNSFLCRGEIQKLKNEKSMWNKWLQQKLQMSGGKKSAARGKTSEWKKLWLIMWLPEMLRNPMSTLTAMSCANWPCCEGGKKNSPPIGAV